MVNSTAAISLVLLVLLSLAIFLAVYYTGAGAGKSINGLGEFTIQLNAPHGLNSEYAHTGYNVGAYSNLKVDAKSGAITSWSFSTLTSWEADTITQAKVVSNGVEYVGIIANGVLNVDRCATYSTAALTSEVMGSSFVAPSLLGTNDDGSKSFSAVLRGKTYTIMTLADGTPLSASAPGEDYSVTSFDANANTLVLPTINQNGITCTSFALEEKLAYNMLSAEAKNVADSQKSWSEEEKDEHAALLVSKKLAAMQPVTAASCPVSWRGDGFCDASCNNAASNYDNGDCCAGQCKATTRFACQAFECKNPNGDDTGGSKGVSTQAKYCAALHGAGVSGTRPATVKVYLSQVSGSTNYWGSIQYMANGCTNFKATWGDSLNYGWPEADLQNITYSSAVWASVRVAHSMGNTLMAGACLVQNKCTAKWYGSTPPLLGSDAVDLNVALSIFGLNVPGWRPSHSPKYNGTKAMMWKTMGNFGILKSGWYWSTGNFVSGISVGNSGIGSGNGKWLELSLLYPILFALAGYNDGAVPSDSGDVGGKTATNGEDTRWYYDEFNHYDGAGRNGDWDPWIGGDGFPDYWLSKGLARGV